MTVIDDAVSAILKRRAEVPRQRALLVAVSGIDGSGKGYASERIVFRLGAQTPGVIAINIDGWLHLPEQRFSKEKPGEHFYKRGFRFSEMFSQLVLPLKERRSLYMTADLADATNAGEFHRHLYDFKDIDIIILEGIFLLQPAFRDYYDFTIWIDCTFPTALERAIRRNQEGLSEQEIIRDFDNIYFAAQRIHTQIDHPRDSANLVIENDPSLGGEIK